jgi:hypothetical protein
VISGLRQQMLAAGCNLVEKREDADLICEARCGALGTDGHSVIYGIPASNGLAGMGTILSGTPALPAIPEISVAKRELKSAAGKVAVFAYTKDSHEPVWLPDARTIECEPPGEPAAESLAIVSGRSLMPWPSREVCRPQARSFCPDADSYGYYATLCHKLSLKSHGGLPQKRLKKLRLNQGFSSENTCRSRVMVITCSLAAFPRKLLSTSPAAIRF